MNTNTEEKEKITQNIINKDIPQLLKACKKSLYHIRSIHISKELYQQMNLIMVELNKLKKLGDNECQN